MKLPVEIILSACLILAGYLYVCWYFHGKGDKTFRRENFLPATKARVLYLTVAVLGYITLIILLWVYYPEDSILHQVKLLFLVGFLFPIAGIDYRVRKIPNRILLAALTVRLILLAAEFFANFTEGLTVLKGSLAGAIIIGFFFFLIRLVMKNSIGMGDVKLFALMGAYQGLWGAINSIFFSLSVSFVIAVALLISRKKGPKDVIPFGPCILVGTIIAIGLSGM